MDARMTTDWAAEYRSLVTARDAQLPLARPAAAGFWDRAAAQFATAFKPGDDRLLEVLEPWLGPRATVTDVGAGTGRHVRELVGRVDWVTAVEPSEGMRSRLPDAPNLTVIASAWLDAEPAPAEVVFSSYVTNSVADPLPWVEHMEASARRRVAVQDRDSDGLFPWDELYRRITGERRLREARITDLLLVLRQAGIEPDLVTYRRPARRAYTSLDAALDDWRHRLGDVFEEAAARAFAAEILREAPDGGLDCESGEVTVGILHWAPRGR